MMVGTAAALVGILGIGYVNWQWQLAELLSVITLLTWQTVLPKAPKQPNLVILSLMDINASLRSPITLDSIPGFTLFHPTFRRTFLTDAAFRLLSFCPDTELVIRQ